MISNLKKQSIIVFSGRAVSLVFSFLLPMITVRMISREEYGLYQQFNSFLLIFVQILPLGLTSGLYYFYPNFDESEQRKLISQVLFLLVLFSLIGGAILALVAPLVYAAPNPFAAYALLPASVVFFSCSSIIDSLFIVEKNNTLAFWIPVVESALKFILMIILLMICRSYLALVCGLVCLGGVRLVYIVVYIRRKYRAFSLNVRRFFSFREMAYYLNYTVPFGIAVVLKTVSNKVDKLFATALISAEDYALYSVAFFSIPVLTILFDAIYRTVIPELSVCFFRNDLKSVRVLYRSMISKTFSIGVPFLCFSFVFASPIIEILFTKSYAAASGYYRLYLFVFMGIMAAPGLISRAFNQTGATLKFQAVGVLIVVPSGYWLIKTAGAYGAILSSLIGFYIPSLLQLNFERKLMKISLKHWLPYRVITINFLMTIPVAVALKLSLNTGSNGVDVMVSGVIYLITIGALQRAMGLFPMPEIFTVSSS